MQVALDELGLDPCFHARFFPYLTDLFDTMYEYASGCRTDLAKFPARELFAGFRAAVDIPPPLIRPVLESFPNAKAWPVIRTQVMKCNRLIAWLVMWQQAAAPVLVCWATAKARCCGGAESPE